MKRFTVVIAAGLLFLAALRHSFAGTATWSTNPSSGDWNAAANWMPNTVPNGPSDIATFGVSSVTNLFSNTTIELDGIVFDSGASSFTITSDEGTNLFLMGAGVVNNSGVVQSLIKVPNGAVFFSNNATAGKMTSYSGTFFFFNDSSSGGSAIFDVTSDGIYQPFIQFFDNTTAADATITLSDSGVASVYDNATAGNAVFTITNGATLFIADNATADHAVATCMGGNGIFGSDIAFQQFGSAGEGHFTAFGASTSGVPGTDIEFTSSATAASGTFVINGGTAPDLAGAFLTFLDNSTADNATITANGGVGGAEGGAIIFEDHAKGGTASISLLGNAELDIGNSRNTAGVTIGSLAGDGLVFLGPKTLTIGRNNQSTSFSGVIQDGGINQGTGGSLTKRGTGTLTLTGANTYTGGTTVEQGTLLAQTKQGSTTGTGPVQVNGGTLGGRGKMSGAVTVGDGSGTGAFLAPGVNGPAGLTTQSSLTFNSDGTYNCELDTNRSKADKVTARGVTINSGALFSFLGLGNRPLAPGTVFIVIDNRARDPIAGTFANLPENSIFTVNGNNFQASYEGGNGNDLTLTVVP